MKNNYDIIVVGAGIAGISASVKAARQGASVLLVERYGFVGGMSTAGMVSPFMKHSINDEVLVKGIYEELEKKMRLNNGMIDNGFYANSFRSAAFNLLFQSKVELALNTEVISVSKNINNIESLTLMTPHGKQNIKAKYFIDTSGDAQLLYLGKYPFEKGDDETGYLQALTLFFRLGGVDLRKATDFVKENKKDFFAWMEYDFDLTKIISVAGYFSVVKEAIKNGELHPSVEYIFYTTLPDSGEASFNTTNILDLDATSSEDLTKAEFIGRTQVQQVVKLLQNKIPGFENSYLLETAVQVGVRETRRAIGEYSISGNDIKNGEKFEDAIARGCYGIDIHGQKDEKSRMEDLPEGQYYEIPLRSLIVKDAENLLVAGRCISSTREGQSAVRIMPTCSATGEACGALAGIANKKDITIRDVDYNELEKELVGNLSKKGNNDVRI
ncbi:MAG: FAD-dependent oxidoreductase [Melioribacteraceae bacterium]|nr:FAD-dependent oxidoreductase [Melioribacteraceae bacterium]